MTLYQCITMCSEPPCTLSLTILASRFSQDEARLGREAEHNLLAVLRQRQMWVVEHVEVHEMLAEAHPHADDRSQEHHILDGHAQTVAAIRCAIHRDNFGAQRDRNRLAGLPIGDRLGG